ncbi:hypothetical protein [Bailinhaonella thermotolerans]|uniref:Lipoprotein n=1 Tax=Bailinhaonella thermotolerans TaxID=1070861 RepID=A0A3A4AXH0_9ACTN|nr:hypothetical protein [Bailinhaonella thermotolerans]RJL29970.1 hypothetical protein D5H75_23785 [Bailinhaonella thermotolerans]
MKLRHLILTAPLLALAVACGGAPSDGNGVASANGGTAAATKPSASSTTAKDSEKAQLDFARCLRARGIDFPDSLKDLPKGGLEVPEKDNAACIKHLDNGATKKVDSDDAAFKDHMVRMARCLREQGIDFPDPGPKGELPPPDFDGGNPALFEKAQKICGKKLSGEK